MVKLVKLKKIGNYFSFFSFSSSNQALKPLVQPQIKMFSLNPKFVIKMLKQMLKMFPNPTKTNHTKENN